MDTKKSRERHCWNCGASMGVIEDKFYDSRDVCGKSECNRALSDAIVTAAVFMEVTKHATWPELVRWSNEPALYTRLPFGKHRGERFDAVPEDYLRWIVEGQNELREEVKASARYWLDRRASGGARLPGL